MADGFDAPWQASEWLNSEENMATVDLRLEAFFVDWQHGLDRHFERDEYYDPRDFKDAFLRYCSEEFDRLMLKGPSCPWPRQ